MAANALTGNSISMRSLRSQLNQIPACSLISSSSSVLTSSFGRRNVSFNLRPRSIRLTVSCASDTMSLAYDSSLSKNFCFPFIYFFIEYTAIERHNQAKQETVDKVCTIVKKQLALPDSSPVTGESKFSALGADSLDTVEIVMGLEEEFGISVEEDSAQSITTVQEAADLIEEIIQKK
ncbi:hypothetical protein Ahy_B06g081132 isoform B [Arachis hypogaea]|uniref:Acyl carrier protein n=1 Tax=Arachis hypogaea TaxID=3818 RepID=A0A444YK85_ARAHY|nr:hypothetical protein Ahy_B06g081132 isoform B [Arachis hypogaea]